MAPKNTSINVEKLEDFVNNFFFYKNNEQLTPRWKNRSELPQVNDNLSGKQKFDNVSNKQPKNSLPASEKNDGYLATVGSDGKFRSDAEERYRQAFINKEGLPPELVLNALDISKALTNFYQLISMFDIKKWNFWNIILHFKNNPEVLNYLRIINPTLFKNTQLQIELLKKGEEIAIKYLGTQTKFLAYYRIKEKDENNSINILSIHNVSRSEPIKISDILQQEKKIDKLKLYHQDKIQMVACLEDNGIRNYKFKEDANYEMTINWSTDGGAVKMVIMTGGEHGIEDLVSLTHNGKDMMQGDISSKKSSFDAMIDLIETNSEVHINSLPLRDTVLCMLGLLTKPCETLKEVKQKKQRNFSSNKECTDSLFNDRTKKVIEEQKIANNKQLTDKISSNIIGQDGKNFSGKINNTNPISSAKIVEEEKETNLPWSRDDWSRGDSTNYILSLLDKLNLPNQDKSTVVTVGNMQKYCENAPKLEIDYTQKQKCPQNILRERQNQKYSSFPVKTVMGEQKKGLNDKKPNDQGQTVSWDSWTRKSNEQKGTTFIFRG